MLMVADEENILKDFVKVQYSDYYIAFLDALGFSEKIKNSNQENIKRISTHFTVLKRVLNDLKSIKSKSQIIGLVVSDSVIIAIPCKAKNDSETETLRELCIAVRDIQWNLAKYDIWFRGAITKGDCWISNDGLQITGPAYLKALELEKTAAKYPRVIIDPAIFKSLKINNRVQFIEIINNESSTIDKSSSGPVFDWGRTKRIECDQFLDDTMTFIDYIGLGIPASKIEELRVIVDYLERALCEQKIYEKFRWLVNYCFIRVGTDYFGGANPHLEDIYEELQIL